MRVVLENSYIGDKTQSTTSYILATGWNSVRDSPIMLLIILKSISYVGVVR
jgi:hypothetical protein